MRFGSRRFNQVVLAVVAAVVVLPALSLGPGTGDLLTGPFAVALVYAVVLLAEWVAAHVRAAPPPELPFGRPGAVLTPRGAAYLTAFVFVVTLMREGALAPAFEFSLDRFHLTQKTDVESKTTWHEPPRRSGPGPVHRAFSCTVTCAAEGSVCRGVRAAFKCSAEAPAPLSATLTVHVGSEPFCYVPLFKWTKVDVQAQVAITDASDGSSGTSQWRAEISAFAYGLLSCRNFRQDVGLTAGRSLLGHIKSQLLASEGMPEP